MASPVDTSVKHAHSGMVNAPVLSGVASSLIALLDAFLVDGWGLQTASSLVVSGGVATLTFPSAFPATVHSVILVAGATPSDLNGEQKITQVLTATNQVRFATTLPNGTATGTITVKMAPAGWSKPFSGTNKAVYRSVNPQAHGGGFFFRVDDSGTTFARVRGYETMVDVDTGTGPFPTESQVPGGGYWVKSSTASAVARGYGIAADSRTLYINFQPYGPGTFSGTTRGFGDGVARRPSGDAFASWLNSNNGSSLTSSAGALDGFGDQFTWTPRSYTGIGASEAGKPFPYCGGANTSSGMDSTMGTYPNPIDGAVVLSPRYWATSTTYHPRFEFPGIYHVPQNGFGPQFDSYSIIPAGGSLLGRALLVLPAGSAPNNQTQGGSLLDITGPWR